MPFIKDRRAEKMMQLDPNSVEEHVKYDRWGHPLGYRYYVHEPDPSPTFTCADCGSELDNEYIGWLTRNGKDTCLTCSNTRARKWHEAFNKCRVCGSLVDLKLKRYDRGGFFYTCPECRETEVDGVIPCAGGLNEEDGDE